MSLEKYIDDYKPTLNKQPYHVLKYKGKIESDTCLQCEAPTREVSIYGSPGNGCLYKIGTLGIDGIARFDNLYCVCEAYQCSYSWTDSSSCSLSQGYVCSYITDCVHSCNCLSSWTTPYYAYNDPVDVKSISYKYYRANCCVSHDIDGCPIYNYSCVATCPLTSGYTYDDNGGYTYRKICRVNSEEMWIDDICSYLPANSTCSSVVKRCDMGSRQCVFTTCYQNICEWKDINGCTVCSPLSENNDDCVYVYSSSMLCCCWVCCASRNNNYRYYNFANTFPWCWEYLAHLSDDNRNLCWYNDQICDCSSCISAPHRKFRFTWGGYGICDAHSPATWNTGYDSDSCSPPSSTYIRCSDNIRAQLATETPSISSYSHVYLGNPNGIHTSSDLCHLCEKTDNISFDTDEYNKWMENNKDKCSLKQVMRHNCESCGFGTGLVCHYECLILDCFHTVKIYHCGGCACNMNFIDINYYAQLPVVKRWSCRYYVDETHIAYRDYSKCEWCIYMEYI